MSTEATAGKQDGVACLSTVQEFVSGVTATPNDEPDHVVSVVHGIRDLGLWQHAFDRALSLYAYNVKFEPVSIGWYASLLFIARIGKAKNESYVLHRLNEIQHDYPNSKHSIVAHSYGTEMVAQVILRVFGKYKFVFLCGGVAKRDCYDRFISNSEVTVNDCSTIDHWPLIAEALNPISYQATGTFGMRNRIQDRFWQCRHGDYMHEVKFEKNILPIICGLPINNGLKPTEKLKPIYVLYVRCMIVFFVFASLLFV